MALYFNFEPGSKAFIRFIYEVKKRLLNSVLFIDTSLPEFNDYNRALVVLNQELAIAKTLFYRGARQSFLELAERIIAMAQKFEFVNLVFDALSLCKTATIFYPQHKKEYLRYQELFGIYKQAYYEEIMAKEAYEALIMPLTNKKGLKKKFADLARQLLAPLHPIAANNQFTQFQHYYRLLSIYTDTLEHNWDNALVTARSASVFFKTKTFQPTGIMLGFAIQEAGCLIMLGKSGEAGEVLQNMMIEANDGMPTWFKIRELSVVNAFYSSNYASAWETVKTTLRHPRFSSISAMDQEYWRLYQGYLYFLAKTGALHLSPREKGDIEKFRLSSLLNNLPLFSLDKRGANIPLLIVQVLFLLLEDRHDDFDNRVEALRKYRQRNLDPENEHFRTTCFIRLVELIIKNGYRLPAIQEEAAPLLEKMASVSVDLLDRSYELEVLPYERQWQWIVALLAHQPIR